MSFPKSILPAIFLLLLFGGIGMQVHDDFGLAWDEPNQRNIGLISYNYIVNNNPELLTYKDRDYGVAFELLLVGAEKLMGLQDFKEIFRVRHLLTHLFFLTGGLFLYLLCYELFRSRLLAVIAFLLLVLHPRLYAHSFFNTKDIPFLTMLIINLYLMVQSFTYRKAMLFLAFGIATGLFINIRIMGVMLIPCVLLLAGIDHISQDTGKVNRVGLACIALYLITLGATLYLSWPYLWSNPLENFLTSFANMAKFRWNYEIPFFGRLVRGSELPWTYIPLYFVITTPLIYLLFGAIGCGDILQAARQGPLRWVSREKNRYLLVMLLCFLGPVLTVILLGSVLYDDWRQLYFIYPPFVLLALHGIKTCLESPRIHIPASPVNRAATAKFIGLSLLAMSMLATAWEMILLHPFSHLYFNRLIPRYPEYIRKNFDQDYWGTHYRFALEEILRRDGRAKIKVVAADNPGWWNKLLLPVEQRARFTIDIYWQVDSLQGYDYFMSGYRFQPQGYPELAGREPWYSIQINNSTIFDVWKLR